MEMVTRSQEVEIPLRNITEDILVSVTCEHRWD